MVTVYLYDNTIFTHQTLNNCIEYSAVSYTQFSVDIWLLVLEFCNKTQHKSLIGVGAKRREVHG